MFTDIHFFDLCCYFCKLREKYKRYFNLVFCIRKRTFQSILYMKTFTNIKGVTDINVLQNESFFGHLIYIWGRGSLGSIVGGSGCPHSSFLFCVNVSGMRPRSCLSSQPLTTGSLDSPPRQVVYPPTSMFPPWVTASRFLAGNRETELKPTIFSSLLRVFLFFLFSYPPAT